jgi:hypothetical protein
MDLVLDELQETLSRYQEGLYAEVFDPLSGDSDPSVLGLRLYGPWTKNDDLVPVLENVLQVGLGERAASEIQRVEAAPLDRDAGQYIALADLPAYLEWQKTGGQVPFEFAQATAAMGAGLLLVQLRKRNALLGQATPEAHD